MTYRRPPSPTSAVDALARTMGRLRGEELRAPLAGGRMLQEVCGGVVLADDVPQQVASTPWRARAGGFWHDVLATISDSGGRLSVGLQAAIVSDDHDLTSGSVAFTDGIRRPGGGGWSTVDVLCYVGSTLVDTVPLTSSVTTKRKLISTPVAPNAQISFVVKVDSSTATYIEHAPLRFSMGPGLVSQVSSEPWRAPRPDRFSKILATLKDAPSTGDVDVAVKKDTGSGYTTVTTVTIDNAADGEDHAYTLTVAADDLVLCEVTDGNGSGAAGLSLEFVQ